MALRTIVQDGDPILKKVCRPVTKFDDRLGTLLDDMKETLLDANGLGLAGPQVGMMRRLFICLDDRDMPEEVPENYKYKFIEFIKGTGETCLYIHIFSFGCKRKNTRGTNISFR